MIGMYEILKADAKITISEELFNDFKAINASLAEACGLGRTQTTRCWKTIRAYDGRQFQSIQIRTNDRRQ